MAQDTTGNVINIINSKVRLSLPINCINAYHYPRTAEPTTQSERNKLDKGTDKLQPSPSKKTQTRHSPDNRRGAHRSFADETKAPPTSTNA